MYYKLSDFNKKDIERAKQFLKNAFYGYLEICLDDKVNQAIDQLMDKQLYGDDEIIFCFKMKTIGNDILSAIGASILENRNVPKQREVL